MHPISATSSVHWTARLFPLVLILPVAAQLPANYQPEQDWLVQPAAFTAEISETEDAVILDNGLLRRVIDKELGTTVSFESLLTGESVIRAVMPEGVVTIDGTELTLGGAAGQPNLAYIDPAWLAAAEPAPGSMELVEVTVSEETAEHFAWGRVRHHAPDAVWPPAGQAVRLDYRLRPGSPVPAGGLAESDAGRELLFEDALIELAEGWTVHTSPAHPRSSFSNEGKAGEIYTLPDTAVFAERAVPAAAALFEATFLPGTDDSTSWGPGLALVWPQRTIKFNLRPGGLAGVNRPVLGIWDGQNELPQASGDLEFDFSRPQTLRLRLEDNQLHFEARQGDDPWRAIHRLDLPADLGAPTHLRVGKLDLQGGASDRDAEGEPVRLRVDHIAIRGACNPAALETPVDTADDLLVSVHYELYDGLPCLSKWITVHNGGASPLTVDSFVLERLRLAEHGAEVEQRTVDPRDQPRQLHVETDFAFGGFAQRSANDHAVRFLPDPAFETQANYSRVQPCLLEVAPTSGPAQRVEPGGQFETFRAFELVQDSEERERHSLALRRMYRTLAPWVTENPLMFHLVSSDPAVVRAGIDQAAETGFEMVLLSFGSGFDAENEDPAYRARWAEINEYARSKGIELGAYSLYSSRRIGDGQDIVPPAGERNQHGSCPAITSEWGQGYLRALYGLFEDTGFSAFEHDGPYPGDVDSTPRPPLQQGSLDSRWVHWRLFTDLYQHLRAHGVYLNLPDFYYLAGSNKCGMGYREVNWSLPRPQQLIHTRQNIFDGTWEKTPSMGWMFVPLIQYHGGGAAAIIEPLSEHLDHYRAMLLSNLGLGVQACYRGTRLYDTDSTRDMVRNTVAWFKQHRDILESDLIHGRRADGRDLDWMLHVNPQLEERALLAVYNPTEQPLTREISVPLYYAGLEGSTLALVGDQPVRSLPLDADRRARITITVPAGEFLSVIFRASED